MPNWWAPRVLMLPETKPVTRPTRAYCISTRQDNGTASTYDFKIVKNINILKDMLGEKNNLI